MIIFAMDETGQFEEGMLSTNHCSMIGGFGFLPEGNEQRNIERERERIAQFLIAECERVPGAQYPRDLHYTDDRSNRALADNVKQQIFSDLACFLQGKEIENFSLPRIRGEYLLYGITVDATASPIPQSIIPGNMVSDHYAANRYEHAVNRLFENLLLYNPVIGEEELRDVHLELATRIAKLKDDPRLPEELRQLYQVLRDQLKTLGYGNRIDQDGNRDECSFIVTDPASYRAVLSQMLVDSKKQGMDAQLFIQSINYNIGEESRQTFLYFADVLCSYFSDILRNCNNVGMALRELKECCRNDLGLPPARLLFWAYSDVDNTYREAFQAVERRDYFEALYLIAEKEGLQPNQGALVDYYSKNWFRILRNMQKSEADQPEKLEIALYKLLTYIDQPGCSLVFADRIYKDLRDQAVRYENMTRADGTILYPHLLASLYRAGFKLYNHHGNYDLAEAEYNKCLPLAKYISAEEFVDLRNLLSVQLTDKGEYWKAKQFASKTVDFVRDSNALYSCYEVEVDHLSAGDVYLGRALSQRGQCFSYLKDYVNAGKDFETALELFKESPVDAGRTRSYYLHALIESGNEEEYRRQAKLYFGSDDPGIQLQRIEQLDEISAKYALYVYIKAYYMLFRDSVTMPFPRLRSIVNKYTKKPDEHPWELILKYCAFFAVKAGKLTEAEEWMKLAHEAIHDAKGVEKEIVEENDRQYERLISGGDPFDPKSRLVYMYR